MDIYYLSHNPCTIIIHFMAQIVPVLAPLKGHSIWILKLNGISMAEMVQHYKKQENLNIVSLRCFQCNVSVIYLQFYIVPHFALYIFFSFFCQDSILF